MDIDTKGDDNKSKHVKFDNLYDLLFNNSGQAKHNVDKKLVISGDRLDFLETQAQNIQIKDTFGGKNPIELDKLKISKQFKLVNPVPKFQSVPATPQFFDLAGGFITYPDLAEPLSKYKAQGGLFKKL